MTSPAPRWAILAAWTIPLLVLPSAIWRAVEVPQWYPLLLSALSLLLATSTLSLVHQPAAFRRLPPRLVHAAAVTGAVLLIALCTYVLLNHTFHFVTDPPVTIGRNDPPRPVPGADVMALYAPMLLWGPLLLAVATDYRRRNTP